jgi:RNA polymerase sigma-70 factor, ECF subfamily
MTVLNFPGSSNASIHTVSLLMKPRATESDEQRPVAADADVELVRRTIAGDRRAFDELIRRYQRQAVAVSYRLLGDTHDAMEVTQDAFLKSFTNLRTLKNPEAFAGWLMRIVSNLSLNYRRGRKTRTQLRLDDALGSTDGPPAPQNSDPLRSAQGGELGARLHKALAQLPEKQRTAIVMFTIEQLPQKQIAQTLGCSVEAVKWHVFQGRKKLKELLKDYI